MQNGGGSAASAYNPVVSSRSFAIEGKKLLQSMRQSDGAIFWKIVSEKNDDKSIILSSLTIERHISGTLLV
ncbi:hypothetical protein CAter282_2231 [Collimonas arenae]|uniref:Uncharacterized protein n=1 Tax=Collimonas arenae TaxID=279058 RepID=A0A127PQK1_9BURK|nr:hypothetical protein [Collimonas arenae]AMP00087.1 hypothetical protein CAter10_2431 [Collimonas arenae]AMP09983.1 hypothetical protein CAter282_2231 [Collimonas arenae]